MKKQCALILIVLFVGTMGWQVGLAEEETAKPLPSDEEFLAPFSLEVQEAFFELSQEERDAAKALSRMKHIDPAYAGEVLLIKDDFLRKYKLGIDEVQKFRKAERKRKEPLWKLQKERLEKSPFPFPKGRGSLMRHVIEVDVDCVLIGTVKEVQGHSGGPYFTWVIFSVEQYLKGALEDKEVVGKMISASKGFEYEGEVMWRSDAPQFTEGERVLVTLSKDARRLHNFVMRSPERYPPGSPYRRIAVCEGYFEIRGKYIIQDDKVKGWDLNEVIEGIRFVLEGGEHGKQK